jgi:hypothetical protein
MTSTPCWGSKYTVINIDLEMNYCPIALLVSACCLSVVHWGDTTLTSNKLK